MPDVDTDNFSLDDLDNAEAVLFRFSKHQDDRSVTLWAYQKINSSAISADKGTYVKLKIRHGESPDVFEEMPERLLTIAQTVDLLVVEDEIIMGSDTLIAMCDDTDISMARVDLLSRIGVVED